MNSKQSRQFAHNSLQSTVHSLAFTLAETLVVMGIIGVVGILVIPNVNHNSQNIHNAVKLKKLHTNLQQALMLAINKYGPLSSWYDDSSYVNEYGGQHTPFTDSFFRYCQRISEFLNVQKSCGDVEINRDGSTYFDKASIILTDGSYIRFDVPFWGADSNDRWACSVPETYYPLDMSVDIDGLNKGKNTAGIDKFQFYVSEKDYKLKSYGGSWWWKDEGQENYCYSDDDKDFTLPGPSIKYCFKNKDINCTAWVMKTGNMDYLDADENGKCKQSNKTLSVDNGVFSCK
ncbi:type II secretion system protein [bacterium]|nr:type II secretion system protein [bacterium]